VLSFLSIIRHLREIKLEEPIRYGIGDGVELWLNDLLCLNCCNVVTTNNDQTTDDKNIISIYPQLSSRYQIDITLSYLPDPELCELYYVNRDTLFSYNKISELFLQHMMSLYVSSHYKNQPNDLQLMSDAPAHQLYVLLSPQNEKIKQNKLIPDILAVIQVCLEGNLTKKLIKQGLLHGKRLNGDLIPWVMSQQFQDDDFARLSGARVVRIAVHPHIQSKGYGSRALKLLTLFF